MDKEQLLAALQIALNEQNQTELENLAKQAVSTYPNEAFGYYYLAMSLTFEIPPRFPQAEICLAKALELDKNNLSYMTAFAMLKETQALLDDAQIMWQKILHLDSNNVQALIAIAAFQLRHYQDYNQAIELLHQAISNDAENPTAYLYRAESYLGLELYGKALADINKALEAGFNEAGILLKIAILKALDEKEEAFASYEILVTQVPDNQTYHFNYGQDLLTTESFEKAAEQLKIAVSLLNEENQHPLFYRTLGQACLYALQLENAATALEKCIALDADENEAFLMLIETQIAQEKYPAALANIEKLLKKATNDKSLEERALLLKGNILLEIKKLDEAEAVFMPIAKSKSLRQNDAYYGLGRVYQQKEENDKAYKFMKSAHAAQHPLAKEFIHAYLQDFLKESQTRSLEANKGEFEKNAASPVMQKLFGKLWKFNDLDSKKLNDLPAEFRDNVKESMQLLSMIFTETGAVLVSDDREETLTYRIKKEAPNGVLVEFLPLDNFPAFVARLKFTEDGRFGFSREENETLFLQSQDLNSISNLLIDNFKKHFPQEQIAYLGNTAKAVLERLY